MKKMRFVFGFVLALGGGWGGWGCQGGPAGIRPDRVPRELLPVVEVVGDSVVVEEWRVRVLEMWMEENVGAGDDDQPAKAGAGDDDMPDGCGLEGAPSCKRVTRGGTYYCMDVCGQAYWMMPAESGGACVDGSSGQWYRCDGFGGPHERWAKAGP